MTARDEFGNPIAGVAVTLAATGDGNMLVQPADSTDESGQARGSFSSTVAGTKSVSATVDSVAVLQIVVITVRL